jgi:hypothetical protein
VSTDLFRENGFFGLLPVQDMIPHTRLFWSLRLALAGADLIGMACPFLKTCSMFRTLIADEETEYLAWAFCRTIYEDCGRYKRAVAGQDVPRGLLPTGDLVAAHRSK